MHSGHVCQYVVVAGVTVTELSEKAFPTVKLLQNILGERSRMRATAKATMGRLGSSRQPSNKTPGGKSTDKPARLLPRDPSERKLGLFT